MAHGGPEVGARVIVADANLLSYFLLPCPHHLTARAVFERDPEWHAPLLWRSEFANVLTMAIRQKGLTLGQAKAILDTAESLLSGREHAIRGADVLHTATECNLTAYDAEFVVLAKHLNVPLITEDKAVLKAAPRWAKSPLVFAT